MNAKIIPLFFLLALAQAGKPFEGVDPNSQSCDPAGQVYLLLPHFTDCHKFFMCTHGEEVEFSCAGGLIFDFENQGCNWDFATTCELRTNPDLEIEGSGDDGAEWKPESTSEDSVFEDEPSALELGRLNNSVLNCAIESARQVPYKGDCQRYWKCEKGVPQVVYCIDGLFFNEKTQQCDFEANVQCSVELDNELAGEYIVY